MERPITTPSISGWTAPADDRTELAARLDDLRGLGILPAAQSTGVESEAELLRLGKSLADILENTQRRMIETSIQLLSLRELVAKLLSLRTAETVTETVALYLTKAFDHERVLVGVYDPGQDVLNGWVAVRNGPSDCRPFRLEGNWHGVLRDVIRDQEPQRGMDVGSVAPFLGGESLPSELKPFQRGELGPYMVYPLLGGSQTRRTVGVLAVARSGTGTPGGLDAGILESMVEAIGTALENVLLEEDIRREEAFRKDIMYSMGSGLVAVDLRGAVLTMNPRAKELTGFDPEASRGKKTSFMDPPGGGITDLLGKTLRVRKGIPRTERAILRADGSAFPGACSTSLLRNPEGEVYGAIVTFEDLTEIKAMGERIRALDRLAALGRFTAAIAHEIRNPLTGIGTGVQYLERHLGEAPDQTENLSFIRAEIERLDRIVEDLFRVTHPHPPRKTEESVEGLLDRALRSIGSLPAEREITVHRELPNRETAVPVDPDQIQQVLVNLIKNAVEATPSGGKVWVRGYSSNGDSRSHFVFQIIDSGPGLNPNVLGRLFEPFFTQGKQNGTGLGLYVSHGIVERHGGELHAANTEAGGAVFTVRLPLNNFDPTEIMA